MEKANACSPYIPDNPSVFSYPVNTFNENIMVYKKITATTYESKEFVDDITGEVGIYRLDQQTSSQVVTDDIAPDGCSRTYLFGKMNPLQEVAILRIKVPTTFLDGDRPDTTFGEYQTRYLSIGAHKNPPDDASELILDYWTANAQMLNQYKDREGYAYIFIAPNEYTHRLALQQGTPKTQPPVLQWGQYQGGMKIAALFFCISE